MTIRYGVLVMLCSMVCGCSRGDARRDDVQPAADVAPTDSPYAPAGAAAPGSSAEFAPWQQCVHGQGGFTVNFPAGWHTNDGSVMDPCVLFDPSAIEVPYASELPADIAVGVHLEEVSYERVAGETFGIVVLSREELPVAGRRGQRRLVEHTGDGLFDAGVRSWQYIADWGDGRTLIAVSHGVGEPDFETRRRVLDEMMVRLQPR
jgi:hypothetical protein